MEAKDYIIFLLSFLGLILCLLGYHVSNNGGDIKFVIGKESKYCYIDGEHTKNLKVYAEFGSLKDCEDFLKNSLFLSR